MKSTQAQRLIACLMDPPIVFCVLFFFQSIRVLLHMHAQISADGSNAMTSCVSLDIILFLVTCPFISVRGMSRVPCAAVEFSV